MEVGEMESQVKEPWIPTTPAKPIVQKRVPICTPGEGNHLGCGANGAIACSEFSADVEKNCRPHYQSALAATAANIAQDNAKTCVQTSSENVSSWVDCSFTKLVALADAASAHSNAAHPSSDGGLKNPFVPTLKSPSMGDPVTNQTNTLLSHHQHSLEHDSIVHDNSQDPQGTSYIACCMKSTSQVAPPTPEAANREESKQVAAMQINTEERNQGETEENIPAKMIDNNGTLQELSEPVTEFAAVSTKTPQQKPRRRKHRPKVIMEAKPKRTRKPVTPKPVQSKENPTGKRKYVRRKGMDKTSIPPTEVTGESAKPMMPESAPKSCKRSLNFDIEARDETSACRENATVHLDKVGAVVVKTDVGHACDLNTSLKQSLNNFMSLPEDTQATTTSPSKGNPPETKPNKSPTNKRRYIRKKVLNKTSTPPTEVTELTKPMVLKPAKISCKRSLNFDIGAVDESSKCRENSTLHLGKKVGVGTEETHEGHANELNTSMQQAFNIYMSLPEDTQAPSTPISKNNPPVAKPKENPAGKRKYVRRKGSNKISTPPTEVAEELTKPMMPKTAKMPCTRSLGFAIGARDESSAWKDDSMDQIVVVEEMHEGLAYNLNTAMKQDGHEKRSKTISKSVALSNPNDFKSSNSPISMIGLQMVGSKRKRSSTIRRADTGSMNLIGARYNELLAYNTKCWVQKKRRSAKGKNTLTTPSVTVTTTKDVRLATCTQEDTRVHAYASSFFNCSISGSESYAAGFPVLCEATESAIHDNPQTFKYISSLSQTRLTERSKAPTQICGCASMTGMTNCDTKPKHTIEQLGISDRQIFGGAERAQKCVDALVAEMHTSLTKKKRTKKESVLFSSAYFSTNEKQQHQNFALGIYHLPSDVAHEAKWRHMLAVDALVEEFRTLNINREARDLRFNQQNAIVPYQIQNSLVHGDGTIVPFQGPFSPIKKHVRPKVDLDEETNRVWNLLMLNINSHGIDGTDEEKAKRWEEERSVFRGRADSFIARMHLVQGDRRFSQWKGSVVDSVVGVFLTQNVSDHLSSSAFMSLAAQFPKKSSSKCKTYHGEGTSLVGSKPQVHIVEPEENKKWDEKLLNQSVHDQSSMTIDIIENSEEKAVSSNDSCRATSTVISLTDEINCRLLESAERNIREHQIPVKSGPISTMTEEGQERSCYCSDRKELNGIVSSQCSVISSQTTGDFSIDQIPEKIGSCSDSNSEVEDMSSTAKYNIFYNNTSFSKLLEMAGSTGLHEVNSQRSKSTENLRDAHGQSIGKKHDNPAENLEKSNVTGDSLEASIIPSHEYTLEQTPNSGVLEVHCFDPFNTEASSSGSLKDRDENCMNRPSFQTTESASQVAIPHSQSMLSQLHPQEQSNHMQQNFFSISGQAQDYMQKARELDFGDHKDTVRNETREINSAPSKLKSMKKGKEKKDDFNWDSLRIKAQAKAGKREKTENTMDSLDWDAVRCADVNEIANTIKERGMNNRLAERIKNFLNRLVEEHGSIDLEWLRDVPPDQAKEYLLSIRGLGLKSVECVRLLTLHHLAFPVDTNVGRIAVRLGWVPLQPLPESLQLHLLELYPVLESIQKYLWPRLCKLDQRTLYELHYQMITFGKVFCTKSKPNCNACPMRGECRHFASAFASARLALPGPEQRSMVSTDGNQPEQNPSVIISQLPLPLPENTNQREETQQTEVSRKMEPRCEINICEPIIEEPATPEPECSQVSQNDIEDAFWEESCEIPTIKLNMEEFTLNLQNFMQENMELQEGEMSKALVALNPEAASIPMPKLKNVNRLRTEHCVYELPDSHSLLEGWDKREPDDPGKYLLAIWTPGETANSIQPPESKCCSQEFGQLCNEKECFSCNSFREANSQIVRGTILIPCRTAMRGSFPLNGTYFQVNEVFADHESSLKPINVPRGWIWNLNRRTVYFGTSIPTIFKGLSTQEIQQCFWRGYVCVRGFDRETRAPRPLMARLHFPASKLAKTKEKTKKESTSAAS